MGTATTKRDYMIEMHVTRGNNTAANMAVVPITFSIGFVELFKGFLFMASIAHFGEIEERELNNLITMVNFGHGEKSPYRLSSLGAMSAINAYSPVFVPSLYRKTQQNIKEGTNHGCLS